MASFIVCTIFFGFAGMVLTWSIYEGFNHPSWMVKAKNYSNAKAQQGQKYVHKTTLDILATCKQFSITTYHKLVDVLKSWSKACLSWTAKTCKKLDKKIKVAKKATTKVQ